MTMPITFNNELISTPPEKCQWTFEDEHAYYLFGAGVDLCVYNIGAFVRSYSASTFGVTGVVVSKKMLCLNFARNDIQTNDCQEWAQIVPIVREFKQKKVRKSSTRLTTNERLSTTCDVRDGAEEYSKIKNIGLIYDTNGRLYSLYAISRLSLPWCFAESGDNLADKLIVTNRAICFDQSILSETGYEGNPSMFFVWLLKRCDLRDDVLSPFITLAKTYRDYEELSASYDASYTLIPQERWSVKERRAIKILSSFSNFWNNRRLMIGISDVARAWTDGQSCIVLSREYLQGLSLTSPYCVAHLIHTMIHETAHDIDSSNTHYHGEEFFRNYHEICNAPSSPLAIIAIFSQKWKNGRVEERCQKAVEKEKHQELRKIAKLKINQFQNAQEA